MRSSCRIALRRISVGARNAGIRNVPGVPDDGRALGQEVPAVDVVLREPVGDRECVDLLPAQQLLQDRDGVWQRGLVGEAGQSARAHDAVDLRLRPALHGWVDRHRQDEILQRDDRL
jgi:hypothetical protein